MKVIDLTECVTQVSRAMHFDLGFSLFYLGPHLSVSLFIVNICKCISVGDVCSNGTVTPHTKLTPAVKELVGKNSHTKCAV